MEFEYYPHTGWMLKKSIHGFFTVFLLCLLVSVPLPCHAALIEGIVLSSGGPVADGAVAAYPDYFSLVSNEKAIVSLPGEKPGQFRLELEPGSYFLTARGTRDGRNLYAYHGRNPISVSEDYRWLPFLVVEAKTVATMEGPPGIEGVVTFKGRPLDKGVVSAYYPEEEPFRGMGLLSNSLDEDGSFRFDLDPGHYVIVARQHRSGPNLGPLAPGDLFCFPAANPLQVLPSRTTFIEIPCYPRDDLEAFLDEDGLDPRGRKESLRRSATRRDTPLPSKGMFGPAEATPPAVLAGRVVDSQGEPRPGLFVTVYPATDTPLFQMHAIRRKSEFMAITDEKGRYRLGLDSGVYYLVAREKVGEAPVPGEYYGLYEGNANHSVTLETGRLTADADIVVERIMP